jgi:hypothetical protein
MSGRKYDVIPQIGGKDPPSDNAIRQWLKQFQETDSVLHRKGAAIETVTPQMENTCREIEYRLDILRAMKGAHVEVV